MKTIYYIVTEVGRTEITKRNISSFNGKWAECADGRTRRARSLRWSIH